MGAHPETYPCYLELFESGELRRRVDQALAMLQDCTVCPRLCHVDRFHDDVDGSVCGIGRHAKVASFHQHFGEESCLRGWNGSGTIFFSSCNLRCVFCQNWDLSWEARGTEVTPLELARMMLHLQERGCHNINFVTPEHVVPQMLEGVYEAVEEGLQLPIVYNTSAYDSLECLELLDGVVDIYMPDFKVWDSEVSQRLLGVSDYPESARAAVKEMHAQVGDLVIDENGVARRGLLIRHLVLPNNLAQTREIMRFLVQEVSPDTFVNVMAQYRPENRAGEFEEINRSTTGREYIQAVAVAREEGIHRFDVR